MKSTALLLRLAGGGGEKRAVLRNYTRGILGLPDSEIYTTEYNIQGDYEIVNPCI